MDVKTTGRALGPYIAANIRQRGKHWFYTWARWLHVRQKVLELDHHECVLCKREKRYSRATTVHHVKPLLERPDLALSIYDEDGGRQLISLCRPCHERIEGRVNRWDDERW